MTCMQVLLHVYDIAFMHCNYVYPACMCKTMKESVCLLSVVITAKITRFRHLGIWATRKYSQSVEICKKNALNHSARPTSIINSVFLLTIMATPIDLAHCRPCAFCSCYLHCSRCNLHCKTRAGYMHSNYLFTPHACTGVK